MSGERRFDGDLRGLEVTDLADQDDVRILPKERPQCGREIQADGFLHLHLIDPRQIEFHRILGRHDVHFG